MPLPMPSPMPSPPSVFLYGLGRPLLVCHAVAALVLCGASVHQTVYALAMLRRRVTARRLHLARLFSRITLLSYAVVMGLGSLLYPRYRVFVRGLFLDRHAPWASNLFDFKENLATLGLPFAVGAVVLTAQLGRVDRALSDDPLAGRGSLRDKLVRLYVLFALGTATIAIFNALSGLLVTSVRGI